jgi:hypothetical protein
MHWSCKSTGSKVPSAHIRPVGALGFAGICRRRGEAWDNRTHTIEEAYAFDWKRKAPCLIVFGAPETFLAIPQLRVTFLASSPPMLSGPRRAFDLRCGFLGVWGRTTGSLPAAAWTPRALAFLCSCGAGGQFFAAAAGCSEAARSPD